MGLGDLTSSYNSAGSSSIGDIVTFIGDGILDEEEMFTQDGKEGIDVEDLRCIIEDGDG